MHRIPQRQSDRVADSQTIFVQQLFRNLTNARTALKFFPCDLPPLGYARLAALERGQHLQPRRRRDVEQISLRFLKCDPVFPALSVFGLPKICAHLVYAARFRCVLYGWQHSRFAPRAVRVILRSVRLFHHVVFRFCAVHRAAHHPTEQTRHVPCSDLRHVPHFFRAGAQTHCNFIADTQLFVGRLRRTMHGFHAHPHRAIFRRCIQHREFRHRVSPGKTLRMHKSRLLRQKIRPRLRLRYVLRLRKIQFVKRNALGISVFRKAHSPVAARPRVCRYGRKQRLLDRAKRCELPLHRRNALRGLRIHRHRKHQKGRCRHKQPKEQHRFHRRAQKLL